MLDFNTGEECLVDQNGKSLQSPTDEIGIPKLDAFAESIARTYELGMLVVIDKASRVPPLEAPVKPEWFGLDSFRQTGRVRASTSIKVAPFDEASLKHIDRLRRAASELLPRFSFAIADGVRWMPKQAIPLFESALTTANNEAKELLGITVGDNINEFLSAQYERIRGDAQRMYEAYHPAGKIPESAVYNIIEELKRRLGKTRRDSILPKVSYSALSFNPSQPTPWSSP